jgi:hypothetical protein
MSQNGYATGMAGEFHVMELLFHLGHVPTLTLGNAKSIDIVTRSPTGRRYDVSVKAMRGGGKWGIGSEDYSNKKDLVFVLLYYKKFDDLAELPEVWIAPACDAQKIKRPWQNQSGLYLYKACAHELAPYKNAWENLA